jgi:hypothetical protein
MTSQIQEKLEEDIQEIKKVDKEIQSEIIHMEKESDRENNEMMIKINTILNELEQLKSIKKNQ